MGIGASEIRGGDREGGRKSETEGDWGRGGGGAKTESGEWESGVQGRER